MGVAIDSVMGPVIAGLLGLILLTLLFPTLMRALVILVAGTAGALLLLGHLMAP